MQTKIWGKVIFNISLILVVTAIVSPLFWLWFGRDLTMRFSNLEIDFFNTVAGIFTIIGLVIALYQISQIKTEKAVIEQTIAKTHELVFKNEAISKFALLKNELIDFQKIVANDTYSEIVINKYLDNLYHYQLIIDETNTRQKSLSVLPIINCDICVTLLGKLINECNDINSKKKYGLFRKSFFRETLYKIIHCISECEQKLKR